MALNKKYIKPAVLSVLAASLLTLVGVAMSAPASTLENDIDAANANKPLSEMVIKVVSGDIRPVLAVAAKYGHSQGVFVGKVASEVQRQFPGAIVKIKAVKMQELDHGCPKIVATIYQDGSSTEQEIPFRVCPK